MKFFPFSTKDCSHLFFKKNNFKSTFVLISRTFHLENVSETFSQGKNILSYPNFVAHFYGSMK